MESLPSQSPWRPEVIPGRSCRTTGTGNSGLVGGWCPGSALVLAGGTLAREQVEHIEQGLIFIDRVAQVSDLAVAARIRGPYELPESVIRVVTD